jgi:N-acyl-D-aspartate/D-glutamate deacylase
MHDLIISGGTLVDGTGSPPRTADVAIDGGVITDVGRIGAGARRRVDATGAIVTPGFVDVHTHYDGQATWEDCLVPSAWHGVTTVVMGNCGVGFAPVRPHDREILIELMEGVEDIPGAALHEGLSWDWQTFPEYLDALEHRPHDIDIGAQLPHGALRLYVMGARGATREAATPDEIAEMGRLAGEAVQAGALGFSTSRTRNHRTSRGEYTPTLTAAADELSGIAAGMGGGVIEVVSDFADLPVELQTVVGMAEASGRPLSISVAQADPRPMQWRQLMDAITDANDRGLRVTAQVAARPVGVLLGLQATLSPLGGSATFRSLAELPFDQRLAQLRRPEIRDEVVVEVEHARQRFPFERMFTLGDVPDYEPAADTSVAAMAARAGISPAAMAYDLVLQNEGRALLYVPFLNFSDGTLDAAREMLVHPHSVVGLGDGGAHVGTICDGSFPTTMLTHWVRDRNGPRIPLEQVVAKQTSRTAAMIGLLDRGVVAPGMRADLNVIDLDALTLRAPELTFDLPAGGKRFLQRADGYLHTIVNGVETYASGHHTGALPGRLVRGSRPAPGPSANGAQQ